MRSALPSAVSRVAGRLRPHLFLLLIFGRAVKLPLNRRSPVFAVKFGEFFQSRLTPHFAFQTNHLLFVMICCRIINWTDGIEQIAVALFAFLCVYRGRLSCDQPFFGQTVHMFSNGVFAHADSFPDRFVARMALKCFPVLAVHQIRIYCDLAGTETQAENFIRQRKIIPDRITLWISGELQMLPPVFSSTHARNFSFGTMSREPIRNDGNPFSCISS